MYRQIVIVDTDIGVGSNKVILYIPPVGFRGIVIQKRKAKALLLEKLVCWGSTSFMFLGTMI